MSYSQNIRFQAIIATTGLVILIIKFYAYFVTGSNSILTDAVESIVNVTAGFFALYSLVLASIPSDRNHPYGHGKIEFISATIEGSLITIAGAAMCLKATYNLFYVENQIQQLDIGIWLTGLVGALNFGMGWMMEKRGDKIGSLLLISGGKHLKSDAYSTVGMITGLVFVLLTRKMWVDNVVAFFFGGMIIWTGIDILKKSIAGIMDEADESLIEKMAEVLQKERKAYWIDIHNFRIIKYGIRFHVDCHITVPRYATVAEAHDIITELEKSLSANFDHNTEVFIHTDPCLPDSCKICTISDCPVRTHAREKTVIWTLENLAKNSKHNIHS